MNTQDIMPFVVHLKAQGEYPHTSTPPPAEPPLLQGWASFSSGHLAPAPPLILLARAGERQAVGVHRPTGLYVMRGIKANLPTDPTQVPAYVQAP